MTNITVVISNYNYSRFVKSAIRSCLAQSCACKIIVVDDASTDGSWEIIKQFVEHGIVAVRLNKNSGGNARGKNVGICLSDTKYVTCLDSDDMLLPKSLETRLAAFNNKIDFVHGWSISVCGDAQYEDWINSGVEARKFKRSRKAINLMKEDFSPRWSFAFQASTVLADRVLYNRFGLYDEEMRWTIDREMWWRWLFHGARMAIVDEFVSMYRKHPGQLTSDRKRKNPKIQQKLLRHRRELRKQITKENTMFPESYNHMQHIAEINYPTTPLNLSSVKFK